jgi:hypothetical protein
VIKVSVFVMKLSDQLMAIVTLMGILLEATPEQKAEKYRLARFTAPS